LLEAYIGKYADIYCSAMIYVPWNLVGGDWNAVGEWAVVCNLGKVAFDSGQVATRDRLTHGVDRARAASLKRLHTPRVHGGVPRISWGSTEPGVECLLRKGKPQRIDPEG
jgi:hypothetical protein